jgi:hypothetical protein
MRAPLSDPLFAACLPEKQPYEIHAGDAFIAYGATTGFLSDIIVGPGGECTLPPQDEFVRLHQARIPLSAPACPSGFTAPLGTIDPIRSPSTPSACTLSDSAASRVLHFENPIFNLAVNVPSLAAGQPQIPPDQTLITFTLTGGANPLAAPLGIDVQAQDPRFAVVSPDHQTVYVVDAGKAANATGLRGQLFRLFSVTQAVDRVFLVR